MEQRVSFISIGRRMGVELILHQLPWVATRDISFGQKQILSKEPLNGYVEDDLDGREFLFRNLIIPNATNPLRTRIFIVKLRSFPR